MSVLHRLTTLLVICLASFGEAQTVIEYWHTQKWTPKIGQTL